MSWNIQGLRDKLPYLYDELLSFDVISFIETWNDHSPISPLPGYLVEQVVRKPAKNNRHYGGILVLIKSSAIDGYERVNSRSENLLWLRICFKCGKRLILGVVYIPPQNSSYNRENTWEILDDELSLIQESYSDFECVLMGDFNAYTGVEVEVPDLLIPDLGDLVPICCRLPRSNKDEKRKINVWGRKLLALCGEHGLIIANGRFGNDKGLGEFTCLSGPTPSVVDYALINTKFVPESIGIDVLDLVGSDHRAIKLELKTGKLQDVVPRVRNLSNGELRLEGLGKRIRYDLNDNDFEKFKRELMKLHITNKLKALEEDGKDIHGIIMELNEIICSCAASCNLNKNENKNERYFDLECKLMKEKVRYLLNLLKECDKPEEQSLRLAEYKDKRRDYKRLIKRKKKSLRLRRNWILQIILEIKILRNFGVI